MKWIVILAGFLFPVLTSTAHAQCFCLKCLMGMHKHFEIQSGSMTPNFLTGACVTATYILSDVTPPEVGDVIYFRSPMRDEYIVKRVVARAGETVQMRDGVLWLNGISVHREPMPDFERDFVPEGPLSLMPRCENQPARGETCIASQYLETFANGHSHRILDIGHTQGDDTALFIVPEGHVFVMGDNRDNSIDSRFSHSNRGGLGMVPLSNVYGIFDGY